MNAIKMIVGLSNPKKKYNHTRHNIGSWYIYFLAQYYNVFLTEEKNFFGFTAFVNIASKGIRLFVPNIFMNINGRAVYKMASFYGIQLSEMLIIHDDLDLKPGLFKLTYSYGHSGHNGLRNVLSYFSNKENFFRCRIGIGRPFYKSEISSFVLSAPTDIEKVLINQAILYAIKDITVLMNS